MKKQPVTLLFIVFIFLIPLAAYVIFDMYERRWGKLPVFGAVKGIDGFQEEHHISDFQLINQDGKARSLADWKGRIVVADFFFTHCPSICPKMTASLQRVNDYFSEDTQLQIASFSVDPVRDSAAQLKKYAGRFHLSTQRWDLLTGDKKAIYQLARNSFMIVATDGDGGPADFIHSDKLVLVDTKGRIRGYYEGTNKDEADQLLQDIKKLKHED
jgi:protein SCO1/2